MKVKDLIEKLKELPQEKSVMCQVVGTSNTTAWNMFFEFQDVKDSDWLVQLRVSHPTIKVLPEVKEQ